MKRGIRMSVENMLLIGVAGVLGFGIVWSMVGQKDDVSEPQAPSKSDHNSAGEGGGNTLDDPQ